MVMEILQPKELVENKRENFEQRTPNIERPMKLRAAGSGIERSAFDVGCSAFPRSDVTQCGDSGLFLQVIKVVLHGSLIRAGDFFLAQRALGVGLGGDGGFFKRHLARSFNADSF